MDCVGQIGYMSLIGVQGHAALTILEIVDFVITQVDGNLCIAKEEKLFFFLLCDSIMCVSFKIYYFYDIFLS